MSPEQFRDRYLTTLKPGVIKRADFVPWRDILSRLDEARPAIEFFSQIEPASISTSPRQIADALLSADDPSEYVTLGFELLGHTGDSFVTFEDVAEVSKLGVAISRGDENAANQLVLMWRDLGLGNVLRRDIASALMGVRVGLACNRRKNLGGKVFGSLVQEFLTRTICELSLPGEALAEEVAIDLGSNGQKKVDFAIDLSPQIRVAFEVNFYTVSGSKPTEIKRAYAELNRNLEAVGVTLVWITDGIGYRKMRKSLTDAFNVHPNIYNYEMAVADLSSDLEHLRQNS